MLLLDHNQNLKTGKINKKYFNIKIIGKGMADLERSLEVVNSIVDKVFVPNETGALAFYKVPLNLDSIISLNLGLQSNPAVQVEVALRFNVAYQELIQKAQVEVLAREKEFKLMMQLHNVLLNSTKTPVIKNYEFPTFQLKRHQLIMMTASILIRRCAYLVQMGLGKTAPALHTFAYRKMKGEVKKGIVFCPKTLCYKWAEEEGNEVEKHTNLKAIVLNGPKKDRLEIIKKFNNSDIDLLITPYSFWSRDNQDEVDLITNIQMFIADESHYVKNIDANVTQNITNFCSNINNGILLSGSPTPNNLTDIFSQYNLIDKTIFGSSYFAFLTRYFNTYDGNKYIIKEDKKEDFRKRVHSKAIVLKSEECIELPKQNYEILNIKMSPDYLNQLYDINPEELEKLDSGKFLLNPALIKLLISCSGWVYDEKHRPVRFANSPKLDILEELLTSLVINEGNKALLWYNFKYDPVILGELCRKLNIQYITITAEEDKDARTRIQKVAKFEKDEKIRVLIGSPKLISEGIDIYSTPYNIYWNLDFRFDKIDQSEARVRRQDSIKYWKHVFYYRLIMQDTVEEIVLRALDRKHSYKELIFGIQDYIKRMKVKYVR